MLLVQWGQQDLEGKTERQDKKETLGLVGNKDQQDLQDLEEQTVQEVLKDQQDLQDLEEQTALQAKILLIKTVGNL